MTSVASTNLARELIEMAHKLEKDTEYLELGGDGNAGEEVVALIANALDIEKRKTGRVLVWVNSRSPNRSAIMPTEYDAVTRGDE